MTYCPRCRVDSHSEEECHAALFEQANKKNSPLGTVRRVNKVKVVSEVREHLRSSRMPGPGTYERERTDELQYILELNNSDNVFALYSLFTYGDYAQAQHREICMSGNWEVMDLWKRHSKRGVDKNAAEDLLREVHSQI